MLRPRVRLCVLLATLLGAVVGAAPGDIAFERKGGEGGIAPAAFPHWIHRIRFRCYACHPALFAMRAGGTTITMAEITAGKSCGVCHDGRTAWAASVDTCNRCHAGQ